MFGGEGTGEGTGSTFEVGNTTRGAVVLAGVLNTGGGSKSEVLSIINHKVIDCDCVINHKVEILLHFYIQQSLTHKLLHNIIAILSSFPQVKDGYFLPGDPHAYLSVVSFLNFFQWCHQLFSDSTFAVLFAKSHNASFDNHFSP